MSGAKLPSCLPVRRLCKSQRERLGKTPKFMPAKPCGRVCRVAVVRARTSLLRSDEGQ